MPSPNIWRHPQVYEIENRAVDPEGRIEATMASIAPWEGRDVLDLGCGTGFHLGRWAASARSVVGVEPHPDLAAVAARRASRMGNVDVRTGTAQGLPLPDASVDVVHARWAYFFGPGCEPGLVELHRVVRRGGTAFVIDNDARRSTFGGWFRRGYPAFEPVTVERFWSAHGWQREPVDMVWRFESREDLEAVVRIEFATELAERLLVEHDPGAGLDIDYAVNLWWRHY
ncbi:MAG: class I SAM-dependent methyltransferase [Nocardioides sp.]